jgi:hypothetical protein
MTISLVIIVSIIMITIDTIKIWNKINKNRGKKITCKSLII